MRLIIATIGHWKAGNQLAPEQLLYERYADRIRTSLELREIEAKRQYEPKFLKKREGELLLAQVPDGAIIVALDEEGKSFYSEKFAKILSNWRVDGVKCIIFLIGGPDGLDKKVRERAKLVFYFGSMTWPHLLVRGMLAEQIYRSECILNGHPYHRG